MLAALCAPELWRSGAQAHAATHKHSRRGTDQPRSQDPTKSPKHASQWDVWLWPFGPLARPGAPTMNNSMSTGGGFARAVRTSKKVTKKVVRPPSVPTGVPRSVAIADRSGNENLRAHYYCAQGRTVGLLVLAPGSRGGMGPGQITGKSGTIGQFSSAIRDCIYPKLAQQLASRGIASVHFTWRLNPTRKGAPPGTLKSPAQMMLGVEDISLAARYLRAQQGEAGRTLPLVLIGFSFGGPAVMAAGALAVSDGGGERAPGEGVAPIAAVVTMGCGMRVGKDGSSAFKETGLRLVGGSSKAKPHEYSGLDSESCVDAFAAAGLPLAMIHGLTDVTVDPEASATIFKRARGPKVALWLRGGDHHSRNRTDVVLETLGQWIPALLERPLRARRAPSLGPPGPLPAAAGSAAGAVSGRKAAAPMADETVTDAPIDAERFAPILPSNDPSEGSEASESLIDSLEPTDDAAEDDLSEALDESDVPESDAESDLSTARVSANPTAEEDAHAVEALQQKLSELAVERSSGPEAPEEFCKFLDGAARTV